MPCTCKLCTEHRRVQDIRLNGGTEDLRVLINQLEENLALAEFDNECYRAIMDGTWPSAREIAQRIIERCYARTGIKL